ncbi:hypothetical protein H072_1307 [Dactylellina haptotyla CBS 200.50]|uniref:DUF7704 domain-containing protein n=1 Tax=Dactylellina haptotyla (strain CBS 200.50) TaxID=1284197 RepID=S8BYY8_DACHA|nr:hypothetical protein H072_1307 [Dactylellina haptotyla CBS 200.50]
MEGQYGLIYRLLFFYLEPISALGGSYLTHLAPQSYFSKVIPGNHDPILTNTQLVLTNLASSYVHFAIIEAVLLRVTNDKRVWQVAIIAMLVNDIIHLYGLYVARTVIGIGFGWDFSKKEDWETFAPSYLPLVLRLTFLAGWDGWTGDRRDATRISISEKDKHTLPLVSGTQPIPFLMWS